MKYDYLCVGAGFFNCTFARLAADRGKRVLIIDKNDYIGGQAKTDFIDNVQIHSFGPHILNTDSKEVWGFLKRFGIINNFRYKCRACFEGKYYSFPINKLTLQQLDVVIDETELCEENFHTYLISKIGRVMYERFFYYYTRKMWGVDPSQLPASIAQRIPFRQNLNDNYYDKTYEGIPKFGYTQLLTEMITHDNITIMLRVDYFDNKKRWDKSADKVIYTGKIDEYFDYKFGDLEYRTLDIKFHTSTEDMGVNAINYTDDRAMTRKVCHNYWLPETCKASIYHYSTETPLAYYKECLYAPFYPMKHIGNNTIIYNKYKLLANKQKHVYFKGRLGEYTYRDMCPTVETAFNLAKELEILP